MRVSFSQGEITSMFYDENANTCGDPVPDESDADVIATMENNEVVLAVSLWTTRDMTWLDGGCTIDYPKCDLGSSSFTLSDLKLLNLDGTIPPPVPAPTKAPVSSPVGSSCVAIAGSKWSDAACQSKCDSATGSDCNRQCPKFCSDSCTCNV